VNVDKRAIIETYGKVTKRDDEWCLRRNTVEDEWDCLIYRSLEELYMDIYTVMLYRVREIDNE
jgi:hypothetical protein